MPSGYTAPLYGGKDISFAQFALRCSRAMGAAIMQRDESIDVEIALREVDDYYERDVEKARAQLVEAEGRSADEWRAVQEHEIAEAIAFRDEYLAKTESVQRRYLEMERAVRDWEPPTEEHAGLKKFMREQLHESLKFDCGWPSGGHYAPEVPVRVDVSEYRARVVARLTARLSRATESLAKQYELVRSQNEWVTVLRDSLGVTE